jgi:hypothetical protein
VEEACTYLRSSSSLPLVAVAGSPSMPLSCSPVFVPWCYSEFWAWGSLGQAVSRMEGAAAFLDRDLYRSQNGSSVSSPVGGLFFVFHGPVYIWITK